MEKNSQICGMANIEKNPTQGTSTEGRGQFSPRKMIESANHWSAEVDPLGDVKSRIKKQVVRKMPRHSAIERLLTWTASVA